MVPVMVAVADPVAPVRLLVKRSVSLRVVEAEMVTVLVSTLVPPTVTKASPEPVASNVSDPPVPFASVLTNALLLVKLRLPTVIAAPKFTVCAAVLELKVADAPTELGTPLGVQLPAVVQAVVPDVALRV
jgi:hypothetical protein